MEDAIAIVGMGCRLPSDVKSMPEFWELLTSGRSAQSKFPKNRFNIDAWYHPDPKRHGSIANTGGYFLGHDDSYKQFDHSFFGIHPLEAGSMDPQQRKLLEVVYETFESAGETLQQVSGSKTACYVGVFTNDYKTMNARDTEDYPPYSSSGSDMTVLSNRINYVFNLKGPSFSVDTACSSSLYALHLACQGLRTGDFNGAIVAGTNIIMDPRHQLLETKLGILSATSTCHTFDESADGFGRAEGITAIYVKRLSDAIKDGNPIRAVIRASAVNTNGKGQGITHPSPVGQAENIRHAYAHAGLKFDETGFVECHGTGTPVGDPIEVEAVGSCFAAGRTSDTPILLSALKSQIGHTEGASGLAGAIKAVLSLEKRIVPATVGIKRLNPALNLRGGKVSVVRELQRWPAHLSYGRASVNSFGYGGANAHVILDAADSFLSHHFGRFILRNWTSGYLSNQHDQLALQKTEANLSRSSFLLVASAHNPHTLEQNTQAIAKVANQYQLADMAFTLGLRRTHFLHRASCIASYTPTGPELTGWKLGSTQAKPPTIAFVFTGQGAQWPRMGIQLVESFDMVRQTFEQMQATLDALPDKPQWTLLEALSAQPDQSLIMKSVVVSITLCTAVQVALVNLLRSWGVEPAAVVGHSSGEAAAAYCAGYFTVSEAITTSYYRACAMTKTTHSGLMIAVGMGSSEAHDFIAGHDGLYVACHNSPQSTTIAGEPEAVQALEKELQSLGIFARIVKSSGCANHSPLMQPAADYFVDKFSSFIPSESTLASRTSTVPMYSCIAGDQIDCAEVSAKYWARNIAAPVLFDEAVQKLLKKEASVDLLIELGPHSALSGPIRQIKASVGGASANAAYLPSLVRGSNGTTDLLQLAGALFTMGFPVDLACVNETEVEASQQRPCPKHIVDLPSYQWSYAKNVELTTHRFADAVRFRKHSRHDLLGTCEVASSPSVAIWRNKLNLAEVPWVKDHLIGTSILFPACGFISMAIEAMTQNALDAAIVPVSYEINNMSIMKPLVLLDGTPLETVFELVTCRSEESLKEFRFTVSTVSHDGQWIQYVAGECGFTVEAGHSNELPSTTESAVKPSAVPSYDIYALFSKLGLKYGPCFQTLQNLKLCNDETAEAMINLKPTIDVMRYESRYAVHPATLDGCLQATLAANLGCNPTTGALRPFLPKEIVHLKIQNSPINSKANVAKVTSSMTLKRPHSMDAGFQLLGHDGKNCVEGIVRLVAADGIMPSQMLKNAIPEPYQRLVMAADVDRLHGEIDTHDLVNLAANIPSSQRQLLRNRSSIVSQHPARDLLSGNTSMADEIEDHSRKSGIQHSDSTAAVTALLQILAFKRPNLRYAEVSNVSSSVDSILQGVHAHARHPRYNKITFVRKDKTALKAAETKLQADTPVQATVVCSETLIEDADVIVLNDLNGGHDRFEKSLREVRAFHSANGFLVLVCHKLKEDLTIDEIDTLLQRTGYNSARLHTADKSIILAQPSTSEMIKTVSTIDTAEYWIVYWQASAWVSLFSGFVSRTGVVVHNLPFSELDQLPAGSKTIVLLEAEHPVFSEVSQEQMVGLQRLFSTASSIDWIYGSHPEASLIPGMARTLKMEYPHLKMRCVKFDCATTFEDAGTINTLVQQVLADPSSINDQEHTVIKDGKAMIMRYIVDEDENTSDRARTEGIIEERPFDRDLRLATPLIGQIGDYHFTSDENTGRCSQLQDSQVRVQPLTYSVNSRNVSTLQGHTRGKWYSHACFGKVVEAGANSHVTIGEYVLCLGGTTIGGEEIIDSSLCVSCMSETEGQALVTYLEHLCAAYYTLAEVGAIRRGQVVLVNSDDSGYIDMMHALASHFGVKVILSPQDDPSAFTIQSSTQVNGHAEINGESNGVTGKTPSSRIAMVIDTIGNFNIPSIQQSLAPNCKVLYMGSADQQNPVMVTGPGGIKKGIAVSYVDVLDLTESEPSFIGDVLAKSVECAREANIVSRLIRAPVYSITELADAVAAISNSNMPSSIALSCEPGALVAVHKIEKSSFKLRADGAYLLIGCLGGLGRSIITWMLKHGARHFIFLSRSGADKSEARSIVDKLESQQDVTVQVIRGDVTSRADVRQAVSSAELPIRGVIQAASLFDECHFRAMDAARFTKVTRPKVQGAIHLHEETLNQPLDFFVMTSSVLGITGATTQSHYAAGNAFLDSFATYRRSLGLPACALSLGMVLEVGHVHEEGLEDILRRRGSHGISEKEFLRMIELACTGGITLTSTSLDEHNKYLNETSRDYAGMLSTGLDSTQLAELEAQPEWAEDVPLLTLIGHAIKRIAPDSTLSAEADGSQQSHVATLKTLLVNSPVDEEQVEQLMQQCIVQKLSALVLIPVEELETSFLNRPLSDLGMDSIVSSDFLAWARRELKVSVDFMEMLAGNRTIVSLAQLLKDRLRREQ